MIASSRRKRINFDGVDFDNLPIADSVSVDTGGTNPHTVKGALQRVFGLDDLGQKPGNT